MDARSAARLPRRRRPHWSALDDARLLKLRLCDLDLTLAGSPLEQRLSPLYGELQRRGISFRPHMWLAQEWFSPDGIPGIAVPFYLAHPRLEQLERHFMHRVEGGSTAELMRILRHEAGHAVDTAFRLRYRRSWRAVFGSPSLPYPDSYRARPLSHRYVHNLDDWYAQSHPTEDFAETFAVWLKPQSDWRTRYAGWQALDKLLFVDALMAQLRDRVPLVRSRAHIEPLRECRMTLAEHYEAKVQRYRAPRPTVADGLLRRVFTTRPPRAAAPRASAVLRQCRARVVATVARDAQVAPYTVQQALRRAIDRAEALALQVRGPRRIAQRRARGMLLRLVQRMGKGPTRQIHL